MQQSYRKEETKEALANGNGHVIIRHILNNEELNGKCKMYAEITLEPGCSIGYHEHHGESETYYILWGEGRYNDNGVKKIISAGDIVFAKDGSGHAIENTGSGDLVFMALIING